MNKQKVCDLPVRSAARLLSHTQKNIPNQPSHRTPQTERAQKEDKMRELQNYLKEQEELRKSKERLKESHGSRMPERGSLQNGCLLILE